jgi:two-component system CheB/CheR fusion protein
LTTKSAPAESPEPIDGQPPLAAQRILIIEDLPDAARSLRMLLTLEGHQVETSPAALDALNRAPRLRPTVIICDIGLPDMDGYELCRRLRDFPELRTTRMIALTGYGQAADVSRALEAGFDLHLTKPVDLGALQDALRPAPEKIPARTVS